VSCRWPCFGVFGKPGGRRSVSERVSLATAFEIPLRVGLSTLDLSHIEDRIVAWGVLRLSTSCIQAIQTAGAMPPRCHCGANARSVTCRLGRMTKWLAPAGECLGAGRPSSCDASSDARIGRFGVEIFLTYDVGRICRAHVKGARHD
jgi:hypothetical protein